MLEFKILTDLNYTVKWKFTQTEEICLPLHKLAKNLIVLFVSKKLHLHIIRIDKFLTYVYNKLHKQFAVIMGGFQES